MLKLKGFYNLKHLDLEILKLLLTCFNITLSNILNKLHANRAVQALKNQDIWIFEFALNMKSERIWWRIFLTLGQIDFSRSDPVRSRDRTHKKATKWQNITIMCHHYIFAMIFQQIIGMTCHLMTILFDLSGVLTRSERLKSIWPSVKNIRLHSRERHICFSRRKSWGEKKYDANLFSLLFS